ncbi:MAG TPA: GNAT family N-acetyltransferase [Verrucomicrobiae bacterium]|nr:GNAT family N-acetyltransferase [Verrucomicrobiae bacterium]
MKVVETVDEVFEAIQRVKERSGAAPATNFFPARPKLENWVSRREFLTAGKGETVAFFRKDRGFLHLYFVAGTLESLDEFLKDAEFLRENRLAADLIGAGASLPPMSRVLEASGFAPYRTLIRLARSGASPVPPANHPGTDEGKIEFATAKDAAAVQELLEANFDAYADQLPLPYETDAAIAARQVLVCREGGKIAALLHFETQGVTSTVRYWLTSPEFRDRGLGSKLLKHYLNTQASARRFTLWVGAGNENALMKYAAFGYTADGLKDEILLNQVP